MDKEDEFQHLSQVFGSSCARRFVPDESPDFTLVLSSGLVLGVEVTSFFASNSAAKLAKQHSYRDDLLKDANRLHRRDSGYIEVLENAKLTLGEKSLATDALRLTYPSMLETLERLKKQIAGKSEKLREYEKRCLVVDLVIADDEGALYWQGPENFRIWLSHFLPRATVLESGFREIYLTTSTPELGRVTVALRGSLLASDFHVFSSLVRNSTQASAVLFECLRMSGYGAVHVSNFGEVTYLRYGAWLLEHRCETFTAFDLRLGLGSDSNPTLDELATNISVEARAEAQHLVIKRSSMLGGAGLLLVEDQSETSRSAGPARELKTVAADQPSFIPQPSLKLWLGQRPS